MTVPDSSPSSGTLEQERTGRAPTARAGSALMNLAEYGNAPGRDAITRDSLDVARIRGLLGGFVLAALMLVLAPGPADAGSLKTDTSKALVPLDEIISGGPPPDGIPAIDRPTFVAPAAADAWLRPKEPVLALEINGDARAYPLQILMWHEIVNDTVGGRAVAVTYCPLCNSGLVYDRVIHGQTVDFGTSGKLYKSDLVMYDRQTHSLWAQMEGRAIVGERAGARLARVPANTIAYEDFKAAHPNGKVLLEESLPGAPAARGLWRGTPEKAYPIDFRCRLRIGRERRGEESTG